MAATCTRMWRQFLIDALAGTRIIGWPEFAALLILRAIGRFSAAALVIMAYTVLVWNYAAVTCRFLPQQF